MNRQREANIEFLKRRQNRLRQNRQALKWLRDQGLCEETIDLLGLGLADSYADTSQTLHENALLAPVRGENGQFINKTIYFNIPGVTVNPDREVMWMKGASQTYYADKYESQAFVIVCGNIWDVWLTRQSLHQNKSAANLLFICSTPNESEELPEEWQRGDFWTRFQTVFLGFQNTPAGERQAVDISRMAGCETRRLRPPLNFGPAWTDFWKSNAASKEFLRLVSDASIIGTVFNDETDNDQSIGRFGYKPIDIGTSFHRGNLYYPVETVVNSIDTIKDADGTVTTRIASRTETVVVRSDRTKYVAREEPAPRGTPPENRILRLTDGTLLAERPRTTVYSTWNWQSIEAYLQKRSHPRPLKQILADVKKFLRREVWLPFSYDYDLLALLVPVTFAQAIFQAVPMILVTGEAGSGKSTLGRAMCEICANAVPVGQISAAAVARLIHETKGFVLLDDLEAIGRRSKGNSAQFNDLLQVLKLSYNKDTSWKVWTDVKQGMKSARLNFFGVKMINNTTGSDPILGSRMLKVITRKMPEQLSFLEVTLNDPSRVNPNSLRDELHTWTFENVALIATTYQRLFPKPVDRATEIAAPLRVFAEIAGDEDLAGGLEKALSIKKETVEKPVDPIDLMMRAVRNIVRDGYRAISTTHITLEMKAINSRQSLDTSEPYKFKPEKWESATWVGRHLRTYSCVETNAEVTRTWLYGKSLRIHSVRYDFLEKIAAENKDAQTHLNKKPLDFCGGCDACIYRELNCPMMSSRLRAEGR